jgi:hypothetical protein
MILKVLHNTEIDKWIKENHYLKSTPAGAVLRLEFLDDNNNRIGAMMFGRPVSPKVDQKHILELTRMYFIDDTEHCAESKALSMARKYIRKHYPQITGLIAYSSTAEMHKGIIYQADGWFKLSESKSPTASWENRKGRTNRDLSIKLKFGRSP